MKQSTNTVSLKDNILKFIRSQYPAKVSGGEIERKAMVHGYKASNASRRCRDLVTAGYAEVSYAGQSVKHTWYIAKPCAEWQPISHPITSSQPVHA